MKVILTFLIFSKLYNNIKNQIIIYHLKYIVQIDLQMLTKYILTYKFAKSIFYFLYEFPIYLLIIWDPIIFVIKFVLLPHFTWIGLCLVIV